MGFFGRLFVPLFTVLAATGSWLIIENDQDTIFAIDEPSSAPGTLAPAAGPNWAKPEGAAPPATAQTAAAAHVKRGGSVVVVTGPYPAALARVTEWMKTFERKGLVTAPVSGVAKEGS
jgi:hypothetical protein